MDNHVETMETELENLREMLCGEGCSLDANTLLGVNIIYIFKNTLNLKFAKN